MEKVPANAAQSIVTPFDHRIVTFIGLTAALACWIAFLRWPFFEFESVTDHWDEGTYFTIATRLLQGARLYVDYWDHHPVGIYLIYAAIIAAFGNSIWALNFVSSLVIGATSLLLYLIGARGLASPRTGIIAAFVFPTYMLDYSAEGANTENFSVLLAAAAALILIQSLGAPRHKKADRSAALWFGLVQGLALQIKFQTLAETGLMGCAALILLWIDGVQIKELFNLLIRFLIGFLSWSILVSLYMASLGLFDAWYFSNFVAAHLYIESPFGLSKPLQSAETFIRRVSYFRVLIPFGLVALAPWVMARSKLSRRERAATAIAMAWIVGGAVSAAAPGMFAYHYFIVLAPSLSLLAAIGAERVLLWLRQTKRWASVTAIAVLTAYPLSVHALKIWAVVRSADPNPVRANANALSEAVQPGSSLYVVDDSPWLYPLADLVPATRYPFPWQITDNPKAFGVDPNEEIERIFATRPHAVVVTPGFLKDRNDDTGLRVKNHLAKDYSAVELKRGSTSQRIVLFRVNPG